VILQKLIIENFRQFHGRQEIEFATGQTKNVTVIHAENGFGKTALLNALLWGFYGHDGLTDDLPKPESILHEGLAIANHGRQRNAYARVTIHFQDDVDEYTLTRQLSLEQQADDHRKTDLTLIFKHEGQTFTETRPQLKIDSIMPPGISPFLFFNGEKIDHLAMERSASEITGAIHQMLGLRLLQRTIEDLEHGNVRGRLVADLRDNADDKTKDLLDRSTKLDSEIEECKRRHASCKSNKQAVTDEIRMIDARLAANQETHELQIQRAQQEQESAKTEQRLKELSEQLTKLISEDGYVLFAVELVQKGKAITQRLREEGKIPARVLNIFIEDLLRAGKCICGCELKESSPSYGRVKQLLTIAGDQHFNNAIGALDNAIGVIEGAIARTRDNFRRLAAERVQAGENLRLIKEALDTIHQRLGGKDSEEVTKLEDARHKALGRQRQIDREEAVHEHHIKEKEDERDQLRREIATSRQQEESAKKAQRRLETVEQVLSLLKEILTYEMGDIRGLLEEEINRHFKKIIDRDYWVELSKEFVLRLRKQVNYEEQSEALDVAHSQGQRQVTSLVFIASLVALARRRSEIPTILKGVEGGEYPMVMDSPFGQLGDEFRAGVARWIPSLAPQVVVMVSSSQYKGPVETELGNARRIGRRYMLCYHGPTKREEAATRMTIGGKALVQYKEGPIEFTEIRELENVR
jgi:DNA sulfur modification protein DndD